MSDPAEDPKPGGGPKKPRTSVEALRAALTSPDDQRHLDNVVGQIRNLEEALGKRQDNLA